MVGDGLDKFVAGFIECWWRHNMEVKWCEDFLCLAKLGSFSKSAEQRNVTQPAFSRRIKSLEMWLGTNLIDRDCYPVKLTNDGIIFKEIAEDVLDQLYSARSKFQNQGHASKLDITFASLDSLSTSFFPSWLKDLTLKGPIPATQLLQNDLKECVNLLEQGDCDFVLCYAHEWAKVPLEQNEYSSVKLASERLIPVRLKENTPTFHEYLVQNKKSTSEFLSYSPDCFLGQITAVALERIKRKEDVRIVYENSTATSLKVMVEHGYGFAWIPERLVQKELSRNELYIIQEYNCIPSLEIRLYRPKRPKRNLVEKFWKQLQENGTNIASTKYKSCSSLAPEILTASAT